MFVILLFLTWKLLTLLYSTAALDNQQQVVDSTNQRILFLQSMVNRSVFAHVHIPKAGGTALALALSSNCQCKVISVNNNDSEMKPVCRDCSKVHGKSDVDYTVNRATGWKCGVHPPLSVMEYCLQDEITSSMNLKRKGLTPIYIIMIREPFNRFVSESLKWTDLKGHAVDWIQSLQPHSRSHRQRIPHIDVLLQYAAQDDNNFILPNRQVKMIGGKLSNFDMSRNFQIKHHKQQSTKPINGSSLNAIGASRWRPHETLMPSFIASMTKKSLEDANHIITYRRDILFGLHEQFEEFLCILELIYGSNYRFNWYRDIHTHNNTELRTALASSDSYTSRKTATTRRKDMAERNLFVINSTAINHEKGFVEYEIYKRYDPLMQMWLSNNEADVEFYAYARELFQFQFTVILNYFIEVGLPRNETFPHCLKYL